VCHEIQRLMSDGLFPREIGVLHDQLHVLRDYGPLVPSGVQLNEIRAQTGLEYKAVFVPQVQQLLERRVGVGWEEDKARMLFTFYMTMTRARDRLYLLHCQQWPRLLEPVRPHVEWIEHPS
jgi:superfamily I DNA/RNA helicase